MEKRRLEIERLDNERNYERLNYATQINENMMNYKNIRYFDKINHDEEIKTLNTKITDSEDGTIVRAIESFPEIIRDEEKLNKTDNK